LISVSPVLLLEPRSKPKKLRVESAELERLAGDAQSPLG